MNYLIGQQTELRAVEPEDLETLYRWENDSSLWIYGNTVAPFSRFLLTQYIENYPADIARDNQLRLIVTPKGDPKAIGAVDCFDYDPTHRKAAIGILIDPRYTRRGFGRDALETFVKYAFDFLHLHQLYAHIPAGNTASLALFRACGFIDSGLLRDWVMLPHGYTDAYLMQKIAANPSREH